MMKKRAKPKFHRQGSHFYIRIKGKGWRRPRGEDSLQRRNKRSRGARPTTGYCQPKAIRGLHPCGLREAMVHNVHQISGLDPKKSCIRMGSSVGKRKKAEIRKKSQEKGFKVLN